MAAAPTTRYHPLMNCPACKSEMFVMEYDGLELDHCPSCEGVWFDAGELALLFADSDQSAHPELVPDVLAALPAVKVGEKSRHCPTCRKTMRKVNIGPRERVLVDACPSGHGLFFDRGEVADLARDMVADNDNPPARLIAFLGGVLGRSDAAAEPEEPA